MPQRPDHTEDRGRSQHRASLFQGRLEVASPADLLAEPVEHEVGQPIGHDRQRRVLGAGPEPIQRRPLALDQPRHDHGDQKQRQRPKGGQGQPPTPATPSRRLAPQHAQPVPTATQTGDDDCGHQRAKRSEQVQVGRRRPRNPALPVGQQRPPGRPRDHKGQHDKRPERIPDRDSSHNTPGAPPAAVVRALGRAAHVPAPSASAAANSVTHPATRRRSGKPASHAPVRRDEAAMCCQGVVRAVAVGPRRPARPHRPARPRRPWRQTRSLRPGGR